MVAVLVMLTALAVAVLVLALLGLFALGIVTTARQLAFVTQAYRVQGTCISEWRYRRYGRAQRYYRVEFRLRNGQRAELRGTGTRPCVGQPVRVLVRERAGHDPKAQIDNWCELWSTAATLLFMGGAGLLLIVLTGIHNMQPWN